MALAEGFCLSPVKVLAGSMEVPGAGDDMDTTYVPWESHPTPAPSRVGFSFEVRAVAQGSV